MPSLGEPHAPHDALVVEAIHAGDIKRPRYLRVVQDEPVVASRCSLCRNGRSVEVAWEFVVGSGLGDCSSMSESSETVIWPSRAIVRGNVVVLSSRCFVLACQTHRRAHHVHHPLTKKMN